MLETAELGHAISKSEFELAEPALREALVQAQYELLASRRKAVVVLLSGVAAGGRGETAKKLAEWMDPRHLRVQAFGSRTPEELAHPLAWRYWQALPPRGLPTKRKFLRPRASGRMAFSATLLSISRRPSVV